MRVEPGYLTDSDRWEQRAQGADPPGWGVAPPTTLAMAPPTTLAMAPPPARPAAHLYSRVVSFQLLA